MTALEPGTPAPETAEVELIACTVCDALHHVPAIPSRGRLKCARCGNVLLRAPDTTLDRILGSSAAMVVLVISAVFFPFLQISASGFTSHASLLDTVRAFQGGLTAPLVVALLMVIVIIPILRAVLLSYALIPLRLGRPLLPATRTVFRLASELRPWSMAEIFLVGVVVALVKVGGMARVGLGPAFWELLLVVVVVILEATSLCEKTLWRMIEKADAT